MTSRSVPDLSKSEPVSRLGMVSARLSLAAEAGVEILARGGNAVDVAVGLSVADVSGRAIASLGSEAVEHLAPVFIDDAIDAESTVLSPRLSATKPNRGIVLIETRVANQRGEPVLSFRRRVLVPTRAAARPFIPESVR